LQDSLHEKEKILQERHHSISNFESLLAEERQRHAAILEEERGQYTERIITTEESRKMLELQIEALKKENPEGRLPRRETCADPSNLNESEDENRTKRKRQATTPRRVTKAKRKPVQESQHRKGKTTVHKKKRTQIIRNHRLPSQGTKKSADLFDDVFAFHSGSE